MKVSSINNNFSSYRKNDKQNNNQPNFTALKRIEYKWDFNPYVCIEHAEALLALKKSEPLKRFFEKYDGFAKFSAMDGDYTHLGSKGNAELKIYYNPNPVQKINAPKEKEIKNKNFLKKISGKIKNWLLEDETGNKKEKALGEKYVKPPIEHFKISSSEAFSGEECSKYLTKIITKLTDADIEKELEKNVAKTRDKQQKTEQLKKIHDELKDWI